MKRYPILIVLMISGFASSRLGAEVRRPINVLHIISDDLRPALGCYDDPVAKTPAIDRLAAKGVQFDRAYVQYPICGPSRASFLSGLRPQTTDYFGWGIPPGVTLMPTWFRKNGYFTAQFGKVFHQTHILGRSESSIRVQAPPGAWDVAELCATKDDPCGYGYLYSVALRKKDSRAARHVLARGSLRPEGFKGGWFWQEWAETDLPDERTTDGIVVRRAAEAIEQAVREGKPFYVAAGLRRPHQVLAAPQRYFDLYPLESIPKPPREPIEHLKKVPPLALNFDKSHAYKIYSDEDRRQLWRAYYANISFVDAQVGHLLKTLDRLDLWKNTIVVFHSDHGWQLGEHGGIGNKDVLFNESTHTPLIIAASGFGVSGVNCPHPVELVDLFPTLAGLCGLEPPAKLDGVNLQASLKNPRGPAPRAGAISVVKRNVNGRIGKGFSGRPMTLEKDAGLARRILGRSVRTERWCYVEWDDGNLGVELYDQKNDPRELNNLAHVAELKATRAKLKSLLRQLDPTVAKPH
ncbi:MAG: sulfatase [Pirellulaceae bacterium]|nr:sulfatase [Pirellulaceae bacterium]